MNPNDLNVADMLSMTLLLVLVLLLLIRRGRRVRTDTDREVRSSAIAVIGHIRIDFRTRP